MFLFIRSHWSPFILFEGKSKTAEGGEQDDGSFSTSTSAQECDETGHVESASERCKMAQLYFIKQPVCTVLYEQWFKSLGSEFFTKIYIFFMFEEAFEKSPTHHSCVYLIKNTLQQ